MDKGQKVLFAMYKGTLFDEVKVSAEDLALAKAEGYLFDYPKYESHADTLERLKGTLAQIDPKAVADAFLFSLSTRRLEYRSALGSYYFAKAVPAHAFMNSHNETLAAAARHCYLCGWQAWEDEPTPFDLRYGLNFINYTRYKYGGNPVGILGIMYALFDLEQFLKLPPVVPTEDDARIFKQILSCVDLLNASEKAGKLRDAILKAKVFRCSKDEVSVLLGELGICGILAGKEYPSYGVYFANEYERDPAEYKNDFAYPVNRWRAGDGINAEKLKEVFGDRLFL